MQIGRIAFLKLAVRETLLLRAPVPGHSEVSRDVNAQHFRSEFRALTEFLWRGLAADVAVVVEERFARHRASQVGDEYAMTAPEAARRP
jgi:hypothetical protein